MILLTGATGSVGLELAKLLSSRGVPFRALVRNPQKAGALSAPGVELVKGDFADLESIKAALAGVWKVFLLAPPVENLHEVERTFIDLAKEASVRHIVNLSAVGARIGAAHRFGDWHARTEAYLAGSGIAWTVLRPNFFMQNLLGMAGMVKAGSLYAPAGEGKAPFVDVRDIAAVAASCLTEAGHEACTYDVTGPESIGYAEIAAAFSNALARPVAYVDIPAAAAEKSMIDSGMPPWLALALNELNLGLKENRFSSASDAVQKIGKKSPVSIADFIADHVAAFR